MELGWCKNRPTLCDRWLPGAGKGGVRHRASLPWGRATTHPPPFPSPSLPSRFVFSHPSCPCCRVLSVRFFRSFPGCLVPSHLSPNCPKIWLSRRECPGCPSRAILHILKTRISKICKIPCFLLWVEFNRIPSIYCSPRILLPISISWDSPFIVSLKNS